jgi:hypothetical protein
MKVRLQQRENRVGDPSVAQGFGRVATSSPPVFDPGSELDKAYAFFVDHGYVVLGNCLDAGEISHLNEFYDRTQRERPDTWGLSERRKPHHRDQGLIFSQPLLDYPELDIYTRHPASFPLVAELLGGRDRVRFSEFNFRETPKDAGVGAMNFHHDAVVADRFERAPYMPCDWLCAIHYLTDTAPGTPAFSVVPGSNHYATLQEAFEGLGDAYQEVPIYGAAGTCILYDTALFHTRYDGDGHKRRRTWHQYYARGGWLPSSLPASDRYVRPPTPVLTNWNLFPERLALHPDPEVRMFFSHWNTAQCEWVASGFSDAVRDSMPRGNQ